MIMTPPQTTRGEGLYPHERDLAIKRDAAQSMFDALKAIADGNELRPRGEGWAWREDGQPSPHDLCIHGRSLKEDCGVCVADYARANLPALSASHPRREGA